MYIYYPSFDLNQEGYIFFHAAEKIIAKRLAQRSTLNEDQEYAEFAGAACRYG